MGTPEGHEYLALSGIQHFSFCQRQWALIHLEQQWEENIFTFMGQEMHKKTNDPFVVEKRKDMIVARAVPIVSHNLRLYGVADVVEFERSEQGIRLHGRNGLWWPLPVEYKVGRPKPSNWDRLQLCAQAVCLEEMFEITLKQGCLFYGKTRRRLEVVLDDNLRAETADVAQKMHDVFDAGVTPPAEYSSSCDSCSLVNLCIPKVFSKKTIDDYLLKAIKE